MLKEHTNPKIKGTVGLGHAIAYFTRKGITVALPLNDSQSYDLIIEENQCLKKVQVKTSTSETVALRTTGGNQSFHTAKLFDRSKCDYLYALIDNGDSWLIPTSAFTNTSCIKITDKKYRQFKLE